MKDAHMFYCGHDNTMNFTTDDESRLEVAGISADQMMQCIGNAICSKHSVLDEIESLKPYQVERVEEIISTLQTFLEKHTSGTEE